MSKTVRVWESKKIWKRCQVTFRVPFDRLFSLVCWKCGKQICPERVCWLLSVEKFSENFIETTFLSFQTIWHLCALESVETAQTTDKRIEVEFVPSFKREKIFYLDSQWDNNHFSMGKKDQINGITAKGTKAHCNQYSTNFVRITLIFEHFSRRIYMKRWMSRIRTKKKQSSYAIQEDEKKAFTDKIDWMCFFFHLSCQSKQQKAKCFINRWVSIFLLNSENSLQLAGVAFRRRKNKPGVRVIVKVSTCIL